MGGDWNQRCHMQIKGQLSDPASKAWDRLTTAEGVTTAALLAALGEELAEGRWRPTRRVVERARRIDRERHSRR